MEPAFQRGDLLFLWSRNLEMNHIAGPPVAAQAEFPGTQVGEIVVTMLLGRRFQLFTGL
jgi:signal peptidase